MDSIQMPGAIPPPLGVQPNLINPDNSFGPSVALHTICLTLTTVFLLLRLYTRQFITRKLGLDDYVCVLGWACAVTFSALFLAAQSHGLGTHMWNIPAMNIITTPLLKIIFVAEIMYLPTVAIIKLTFLLFFERIFTMNKTTQFFIRFGMFACVAFYLAIFFRSLFLCQPMERAWNPTVQGTCLQLEITPYTTAVFNIISDIYILLLPLPTIWTLNMKTNRKLRLTAVFSMGIFACIASVIRLAMTVQTINQVDATWNFYLLSVWAVLEVDVGFVCSCCLALPAFIDRYVPHGLGHYLGKFSAYFSLTGSRSRSSGHSAPEEDTKRLHPLLTASRSAQGYREIYRNMDIPKRGGLEYGAMEMSVRGGERVSVTGDVSGGGQPWRGDGIVKTVEMNHSWGMGGKERPRA